MTSKTATKVELTNENGFPISFTCSNGTTIAKNSIMTLSDPRTVAAVADTPTPEGIVCAGIASMTKEASDGSTKIAVWTDGIFEVYASGTIIVGQPIKSVGSGYFGAAVTIDTVSGVICGYALETASDGEVINARIRR